jgi:hypothetical protein
MVNVKSMLNDPDSAEFRDLRVSTDKSIVCGSVNAKNKFGGYVGFRRFYFQEGGVVVLDDGNGYLALHGYEGKCPHDEVDGRRIKTTRPAAQRPSGVLWRSG